MQVPKYIVQVKSVLAIRGAGVACQCNVLCWCFTDKLFLFLSILPVKSVESILLRKHRGETIDSYLY